MIEAHIGEIHVRVENIFDLTNPDENWLPFRWANNLHVRTRPGVIHNGLLFKTGDRVISRQIEEAERVLRNGRYLYDVQIRPLAWHAEEKIVDIEVVTRDTWTLAPGLSISRSGGARSNSASLRELNLLGTGVALGIGSTATVDRSGVEYSFSADRILGTWTSLSYFTSRNNDGEFEGASIARPFYSLDTRWAAGISASHDNRVDAVYNTGEIISQYRHQEKKVEAFGGWSAGRDNGWVRRYSLGISREENIYRPEPGLTAPPELPIDENLVAPFFRLELLQDRYEKTRNINQIGRTEYLSLGLGSSLQIGRAQTALGSSLNAWLYSFAISRGFEPSTKHTFLTTAAVSGRYSDGEFLRQRFSGVIQYYRPRNHRWLSYASASGDVIMAPGPLDSLLLGGENGLRGYPLRYQSGDRRVLITLEERLYTDWYWLQLFRVGGAAFLDIGRAWGGSPPYPSDSGWLGNVGFGARIFSVRAAFGSVLHIDLAFPINPDNNIRKTQLLVRTKTSF